MSELYEPEEIAAFLLQEKVANHGISPAVLAQNEALTTAMVGAAERFSSQIWGIQIIGSRSNGTSARNSDLDLVIVKHDSEVGKLEGECIVEAATNLGVRADARFAPNVVNVQTTVPSNPEGFIRWTNRSQESAVSLFEEGIFHTPALRLGQLAVLEVIRACEPIPEVTWRKFFWKHCWTYLGDYDRMIEKLSGRLDLPQATIARTITPSIIDTRRTQFGLPEQLATQYATGQAWLQANESSVAKTATYKLYQGVIKELQHR